MGMAAISVMSWPPMRPRGWFFSSASRRTPARHGSAIFDPFAALGDFARPLQRGQAPSGLLNENSPGVISRADAPQFRQTNFWLNAISRRRPLIFRRNPNLDYLIAAAPGNFNGLG